MSVIEFVRSGRAGLLALETIFSKVTSLTRVEIKIYGFDTLEDLPAWQGY